LKKVKLEIIDEFIGKYFLNLYVGVSFVILISILFRYYFTPWDQLSNSRDAFVFMTEAISLSKGDFSYFGARFVWPSFLSLFYISLPTATNLEYANVMRVVSISISVLTIPIVYLISRHYVERKYAIIAVALFGIEANLIENSIFAITEPIFILIGLLSFYFILRKNEIGFLLSFAFAGLAIDTRLNGAVLFLMVLVFLILTVRPLTKLAKTLFLGILVFVAISSPHIIFPLEEGNFPYAGGWNILNTAFTSATIPSNYDFSGTDLSPLTKFQNALSNEFLHIFRIMVPFLAIFVPFGIIASLQKLDYKIGLLYLVIGISLIVAIPQYTLSIEFRNLFFILPFFCVLSAIGLQKISKSVEIRNILLVLLIAGIILLSFNFLRERYEVDNELLFEKQQVVQFIIENLKGRVMGDLYTETIWNMQNVYSGNIDGLSGIHSKTLSLITPAIPIISEKQLIEYSFQNKIDYLVVDNNLDRHFPVFEKIYSNEIDFPYLEKIFDSDYNNYIKYRVKIFEVNYSKLE